MKGFLLLHLCIALPSAWCDPKCGLQDRDLLALNEEWRQTHGSPPPMAKTEFLAEEAATGMFRLLRIGSDRSIFFLDPSRVFARWSVIPLPVIKPEEALARFFRRYRDSTAEFLWLEYGRVRFGQRERAVLSSSASFAWTPCQLPRVDAVKVHEIDREQRELIERLIRAQVRDFLSVNGYEGAIGLDVKTPGRLVEEVSSIEVVANITLRGRHISVPLFVDLNMGVAPFVGRCRFVAPLTPAPGTV